MSNEIVLPDYLKALVDTKGSEASSLVSATSSVPRISLKGRQFRFIENGEEVEKTPDPIHVIILGVQPENGMSKTFYKGKYNPSDSTPPDCSSNDGVIPDSWISQPQSSNCATCEQNKWGSATALSGKKAKACRDSKRLMVVRAKDMDGTIYVVNVTVSSLRALSEYGKTLVSNQLPMAAVITEISMADSDFPQIDLKFAGVLKEEAGMKAMSRAEEKPWKSDSPSTAPALESKPVPQLDQTPVTIDQDSGSVSSSSDNADDLLNKWN
jgi:hypothetical protein